jgi:glycosyltransferase involved in cell wall biosynthesis
VPAFCAPTTKKFTNGFFSELIYNAVIPDILTLLVFVFEAARVHICDEANERDRMSTLSIIVIFHNMRREARRTLYSLSTKYQNDVKFSDYEVIAIDNGSAQPLSPDEVHAYGPNFRYRFFATSSVSPVDAVNVGVDMATGEFVAVIVDGARMATPGLVWGSLKGLQISSEPFVCALSWHLGPDIQGMSMQAGYDQVEEDRLLDSIKWLEDGYRLFEISTIAPSSKNGFFGGVPPECSWFAMTRALFLKIGGFDGRFQSPGGGFVNHDFRNRALNKLNSPSVVLLGEGVFHQFHGGICTNVKTQELPKTLKVFRDEYFAIRGKNNTHQKVSSAIYLGRLPDPARRFLEEAQPLAGQ